MAYLNNKKFVELQEASRNGNMKAKQILQMLRKNNEQKDIDEMLNSYYNENMKIEPIQPKFEPQIETQNMENSLDISELLDKELNGLIDENNIDDLSFETFLGNKQRNNDRQLKDNSYFKAFDLEGKAKYLNEKKKAYEGKFGSKLANINRQHKDLDKALQEYSHNIGLMLDDEQTFDNNKANDVYKKIVGDSYTLNSLGRYYDEEDKKSVLEILESLVTQYGKQNVLATLNTLKNDNDNYKNYRNGQIEEEINRYSKSLENLLK